MEIQRIQYAYPMAYYTCVVLNLDMEKLANRRLRSDFDRTAIT